MSRTKGSLNKKTLERMEFEQRVREEMEKERMKNNPKEATKAKPVVSKVSNASKFSIPVDDIKSTEETDSPFVISSKSVIEDVAEFIKTDNDLTTDAPKKRRGRPPKYTLSQTNIPTPTIDPNKSNDSNESNTNPTKTAIKNEHEKTGTSYPPINTQEKSTRKSTSKNNEDKYDHCSRCHTIIRCSPNRIDTNMASGQADYHRSCPRYVILCGDCSSELSSIIDNWLFNNGLGVEPKPHSSYGIQKEMEREQEDLDEETDESDKSDDSDDEFESSENSRIAPDEDSEE